MTKDQIQSRASALLSGFREEDMDPAEALALLMTAAHTVLIAISSDRESARQAALSMSNTMLDAINRVDFSRKARRHG